LLWDAATVRQVGELTAPDVPQRQPLGRHVAFSPDGKWIAAEANGKLRLWDAATRAHVRTIDLPRGADRLLWHRDSRLLAVAIGDGFRVIDTRDGRTVVTGGVPVGAWSPDGTELFGMAG